MSSHCLQAFPEVSIGGSSSSLGLHPYCAKQVCPSINPPVFSSVGVQNSTILLDMIKYIVTETNYCQFVVFLSFLRATYISPDF